MNQRTHNPALERVWAEEVRYLHSLWHNGLSTNPNPTIQPRLPISNNINTHHNLRASNQASFKKQKNSKKKNKNLNKITKNNQDSNHPESSGIEWPCEPARAPRQETGWPRPVSQTDATTTPISAEEQAKRDALQLQQRSIKASQDFFARNLSSDSEDGDEEDEFDEGSMEGEGDEEAEFFLGVFKEDCELRSYYEKNCESGEFCCLVCCGSGTKGWKRFKNCVALVQHSMAICRTDRKKAHRAFAEVVCRVLGWDIKRLPSIVLSVGETLGQLLAQGDAQTQEGSLKENDKVVHSVDDVKKEDVCDKAVENVGPDEDKLKDCQGVLKNTDTNDQSKDVDKEECCGNE